MVNVEYFYNIKKELLIWLIEYNMRIQTTLEYLPNLLTVTVWLHLEDLITFIVFLRVSLVHSFLSFNARSVELGLLGGQLQAIKKA